MRKKVPVSKKTDDLRKRAEKKIPKSAGSARKMFPPEIQKLVHESHSHRTELEMQNEALRKSQVATAESQHKYSDLYDFAPVGYFTFDKKGHIIEANITGASLLGMEKRSLAKQPFHRFVVPGHLSVFQSHLQIAHESRSKQICKLKLTGKDSTPFDALIASIAVMDSKGKFAHYRSSVTDVTDITRAEGKLRDIEERYQAIFDGAIEGIYRTSLQGKNIVANPALAKILGYDSAEDVILAIEDSANQVWVDPDERSRFVRLLEEQGTIRRYECQFKKKDGTKIWVSLNTRAVRGSDGQVAYFDGFLEDITERKEMEMHLSKSQTLLLTLINSTSDMIWSVDAENFGILTFNRSLSEYFLHIHGITIKTGMRPEDLLPAGYAQQWQMFYRQALEKSSFTTEYSTSGGNRVLRLNINTLRLGERVLGLSVFAQDITERKQREAALWESERRMTDITFSMADWVWEVDENGVYTYSSSKGEELFGHVIGKRPFDFMPPDEAKKIAAIFSEIVASKAPIKDLENWNIKKNGEIICLLTNGVPILDEGGNLKGYRGVDKDITERKKMEQQLSESQTLLSTLINSTSDMIWSVDAENFGILTFNRALYERFLRAYGIQLKGGERPEDLFPTEDYVQQWHTLYRRALEEGSFTTEYKAYAEGRTIRLNLNTLKNNDVVFGISAFSEDITERKRMETKLQEHLQEIEVLKQQLERENIYLREELRERQGSEMIVGNSNALKYVLFRVGQVAPTDATVLILGETGTGKGMVANAIHGLSGRKDRPMITVNCAALPANLIESELFGREKGAFTGAHAKQAGRFEVADGGTLFLDEIGELPLDLQSKLLRVLQDGEFERLGSAKTVKVDVRVIASTSRDLKDEIKAGRFRHDLFYRLNVFPVSIPPLRKRADDVPELVRFFVDKYARKIGKRIETISKTAMKSLQEYSWPGNVRELEHVIERAVIINEGTVLQILDHLEPHTDSAEADAPLKDLAAMEREHILRVLRETRWKIEGAKGAASILNLNPSTLRFKIKKLGIERD